MAELELLTVDDVKTRCELKDGDASLDNKVLLAIQGVKPWLENYLQSKIDSAGYEDVFFVDSSGGVNPTRDQMFKLKLTCGFVRTDADVTVYAEDTYADAMQSTATVIDPTEYRLIAEKGYVLVPDTYADMYVRVTYTAGFSSVDEFPRWLTESAFFRCVNLLTLYAQSEIKAEMIETMKQIASHGAEVLDAHLRASATAISAIE